MNVKQMPSPTRGPKNARSESTLAAITNWFLSDREWYVWKLLLATTKLVAYKSAPYPHALAHKPHNTATQTAQRAPGMPVGSHAWLRAIYTIVCDIQTSVDHNQTKTNRKPIENSHSGRWGGPRPLTNWYSFGFLCSQASCAPLSYAVRAAFCLSTWLGSTKKSKRFDRTASRRIDWWLLFTVFRYFMMCVTWIMNIFYFVSFPNR